jgi:putative endonuclease
MAPMTAARNSSLGRYGERVAARHLAQAGLTVVDRNWRCELGEVDLVLVERRPVDDLVVVCEVKTRTGHVGGHPVEAVGAGKAERLRHLGTRWLEAHDLCRRELRVDVVGVLLTGPGRPVVTHLRGVA